MDVEILYPGAYPMARVALPTGDSITAEAGAMVSMSPTLELKSKAKGGLFKALGRKLLAGETFFQTTIHANDAGEVTLAPAAPGELHVLDATDGWWLQKGAFLAADDEVELSTKAQGLVKGVLGGEGIFILRAQGDGKVVVSSYGAIHEVTLGVGEEHIVDNGHLVAWNCDYKIEKAASGWISTITSGEGFVCRFSGPGTVYVQTRNLGPLARALMPFMPRPSS
jgi:uncharacterized protein (TIGR00266 family)